MFKLRWTLMTTQPPKKNPIQTWRAPSKQSPAQINVSRIFAEPQQFTPSTSATSVLESKLPAPSESLETTEQTRRQKRERDPSPLNQTITTNANVASRQDGSTAAEPLLERQHSNKRVKRSADIPETTDGTIRRKNSVLNGGWFSQRGRERPPRPKSGLERVESDRIPIQSTTSLQPQPSDTSQPSSSPTLLPLKRCDNDLLRFNYFFRLSP